MPGPDREILEHLDEEVEDEVEDEAVDDFFEEPGGVWDHVIL